MFSSRLFWLISLLLIGYATVTGFTIRAFLPFGVLGDILLYGEAIGFLGFLLRQKWGYLLSLAIQIIFLTTYLFPNVLIFETVFQGIGLVIIFMAKPYFQK